MEIKILLKDGDREAKFSFAGDPLDIVRGITGNVRKFMEDDDAGLRAFLGLDDK